MDKAWVAGCLEHTVFGAQRCRLSIACSAIPTKFSQQLFLWALLQARPAVRSVQKATGAGGGDPAAAPLQASRGGGSGAEAALLTVQQRVGWGVPGGLGEKPGACAQPAE